MTIEPRRSTILKEKGNDIRRSTRRFTVMSDSSSQKENDAPSRTARRLIVQSDSSSKKGKDSSSSEEVSSTPRPSAAVASGGYSLSANTSVEQIPNEAEEITAARTVSTLIEETAGSDAHETMVNIPELLSLKEVFGKKLEEETIANDDIYVLLKYCLEKIKEDGYSLFLWDRKKFEMPEKPSAEVCMKYPKFGAGSIFVICGMNCGDYHSNFKRIPEVGQWIRSQSKLQAGKRDSLEMVDTCYFYKMGSRLAKKVFWLKGEEDLILVQFLNVERNAKGVVKHKKAATIMNLAQVLSDMENQYRENIIAANGEDAFEAMVRKVFKEDVGTGEDNLAGKTARIGSNKPAGKSSGGMSETARTNELLLSLINAVNANTAAIIKEIKEVKETLQKREP